MFAWYPTYAPPRIAETLILSLTCVDALLGKGLRVVKMTIFVIFLPPSRGCVYLGVWKPCCVVV